MAVKANTKLLVPQRKCCLMWYVTGLFLGVMVDWKVDIHMLEDALKCVAQSVRMRRVLVGVATKLWIRVRGGDCHIVWFRALQLVSK